LRLRLFAKILGWGDLSSEAAVRQLVRGRPFILFRPGLGASPIETEKDTLAAAHAPFKYRARVQRGREVAAR
jgi:hypothetical protein